MNIHQFETQLDSSWTLGDLQNGDKRSPPALSQTVARNNNINSSTRILVAVVVCPTFPFGGQINNDYGTESDDQLVWNFFEGNHAIVIKECKWNRRDFGLSLVLWCVGVRVPMTFRKSPLVSRLKGKSRELESSSKERISLHGPDRRIRTRSRSTTRSRAYQRVENNSMELKQKYLCILCRGSKLIDDCFFLSWANSSQPTDEQLIVFHFQGRIWDHCVFSLIHSNSALVNVGHIPFTQLSCFNQEHVRELYEFIHRDTCIPIGLPLPTMQTNIHTRTYV